MESEGEGGFLRGLRDGIDRAPQVENSPLWNEHERERGMINEKSALWTERESCFPSDGCFRNSTLDLDYISKKVRSRLFHTQPSRQRPWLSEVDSLFSDVDAEPADPLTKKGAGAAATWTPSFCCQRFPGPSRNSWWVWERAGKARRLLSYLIGQRAERGEGPAIIPPLSKKPVPFR